MLTYFQTQLMGLHHDVIWVTQRIGMGLENRMGSSETVLLIDRLASSVQMDTSIIFRDFTYCVSTSTASLESFIEST